MQVVGTTRILGIIGNPVGHSLSPIMHNAAIAAMGLNYVYVPFPVEIKELAIAVKGLGAIARLVVVRVAQIRGIAHHHRTVARIPKRRMVTAAGIGHQFAALTSG